METILAYATNTVVVGAVCFVVGVFFSQKVKDFFAGVPSDLRTGLKSVEAGLLADVKNYQTSLVHKLAPMPPPVAPPSAPAPVAPVAPAAPAPAAPAA